MSLGYDACWPDLGHLLIPNQCSGEWGMITSLSQPGPYPGCRGLAEINHRVKGGSEAVLQWKEGNGFYKRRERNCKNNKHSQHHVIIFNSESPTFASLELFCVSFNQFPFCWINGGVKYISISKNPRMTMEKSLCPFIAVVCLTGVIPVIAGVLILYFY